MLSGRYPVDDPEVQKNPLNLGLDLSHFFLFVRKR